LQEHTGDDHQRQERQGDGANESQTFDFDFHDSIIM
jgi:hypothetical protein